MTKTPTGSRKSSSSSSSSSRRNYFLSYSSIVFFVVAVVARSAGIGEDCETAFLGRFDGDEISGAGSGFDTSGDWSNSDRVTRGEEECQELCRTQRQAKAWRLRWHGQPGCTCLKTMTGKDQDQEGLAFRSGKFCTCLLSFNDHVVNVASFSISSFCTSPLGDVAATSRLPNDAVCNLTCDGSYVGAPGAVRCRAGDLGVVGDRAALEPAPDCVLNRTSIFYASVGGGLAALLVLFLVAICCVRRRQNRRHREKYGDGVDGVDGGGESGARGVVAFRPAADGSAEVTEGAVDRRKSYKAATGHGSVDEDLDSSGRHMSFHGYNVGSRRKLRRDGPIVPEGQSRISVDDVFDDDDDDDDVIDHKNLSVYSEAPPPAPASPPGDRRAPPAKPARWTTDSALAPPRFSDLYETSSNASLIRGAGAGDV